ncbi:macro domain-containing protein CT2219-like isoform X3 [Periplaneta americana]
MSRTGGSKDEMIEKEKNKFLSMPLEQKRSLYKAPYVLLQAVQTWEDYFAKAKERLRKQWSDVTCQMSLLKIASDSGTPTRKDESGKSYAVNPELNKKVSLWAGNITHLEIDAIVNAANSRLLGGGGVDGAIHAAAGPALKAECATLNGCVVGDAKITGGYLLPAKHVIHTVGPQDGNGNHLESCYKTCLRLLTKHHLRSVAFPCISTGIYGFPPEGAAHIALRTVREFLEKNPQSVDRVIFCLFLPTDLNIYENLMQVYFPVEDLKTNL